MSLSKGAVPQVPLLISLCTVARILASGTENTATGRAGPVREEGRSLRGRTSGADGNLYSCSAAVIVHSNKSTVWTAAHCLHGGKGGGYSKNAAFVPAKNGDDHPFGVWEKVSSYAPTKWIQDSDVITGDMAAFTVRADPTLGGFVQDVVGAYGYEFRSN
ncbi:trypsin-like serine peptidase [Streptomyces virginiae]